MIIPVVTLFFCPPDMPLIISSPTMVSAQMSSPKICKIRLVKTEIKQDFLNLLIQTKLNIYIVGIF